MVAQGLDYSWYVAAATPSRRLGVNAETGNLENMLAAGILDPTKTLRMAIDTAFS